MYTINVGKRFGEEYVPVVEDIIRTVVIQVMVHALLSFIDSDCGFFSPVFWIVLTYIVLGTMVYHLIAKKLFTVA